MIIVQIPKIHWWYGKTYIRYASLEFTRNVNKIVYALLSLNVINHIMYKSTQRSK